MNLRWGGTALAVAVALVATAAPAVADEQVTLTGTYRRMAVERPTGHVYDDLLVTGGRSYRLRLTGTQRPRPGDTVRVSASSTDVASGALRTTSVTTVAAPKPMAVTGTTKTLAILAYWTAPDSTTQAKAHTQLFSDDANFLRENSYGQTTLSGAVTPWVRIEAPLHGRCYDYATQILMRARNAAAALGYRLTDYHRTLVYFPRCTGSDTANLTGWAYEPGDSIWLNGVMDRRTSVHEHGHSFGMGHARAYACTSGSTRVTLGGTCTISEYGDPFDAMGQSSYVGHFSGPHKDGVGWLGGGRKRVLTTSSASFTLPPFAKSSTSPVVVAANSPQQGRRYWMEYRQPVGFDAKLPAGGTGGLLVHLVDEGIGPGPHLLDLTPTDGTFAHAVLAPGRSWTAPDGVRIAVGSMSSTGLAVTVSGARPEPTPPSAPRLVTARQGDTRALVTWSDPASTGNGTLVRYEVRGSHGATQVLLPGDRDALFIGLTNGTAYTFSVTAVNEAGDSPPASATVTPRLSAPTIAISSPAEGGVVSGETLVYATARPGADSLAALRPIRWSVDGTYVMSGSYDMPFALRTDSMPNGTHTVTATVSDDNGRTATDTATYVVRNYRPSVAITSPTPNESITGGVRTVTTTVAPAEDGVAVHYVEFYREYYWGLSHLHTDSTAPYEFPWDLTYVADDYYRLVAKVYDANGRVGVSSALPVSVRHPSPTVTITSPAASATLRGTTLTVSADVAPGTPGLSISHVRFTYGSLAQVDHAAPYTATFDTSGMRGTHWLGATAFETGNRSGSRSQMVTMDNPLPALSITSPAAHENVSGKMLTVTGTAVPTTDGAPVSRVTVTLGWRAISVTPTADGTWSVTFDVPGLYGNQTVTAKAVDTAGHWSVLARPFTIVRPLPKVTLVAPTGGAVLSANDPGAFVATVVHSEDAVTSVRSVCFRMNGYHQLGCATQQADGSYRAEGLTVPFVGSHTLDVVVSESDGHAGSYAPTSVTVMAPPNQPNYAVAVERPDARIDVQWSPGWNQANQAVREYVVRDEQGTVVARSAGEWATVRPPAVGEPVRYSVEAVNEYGASGATWTDYVTPVWGTRLQSISVTRTSVTYLDYVTAKAQLVRWDGVPLAGARVDFAGRTPNGGVPTGWQRDLPTSSTGWVSVTFRPDATGDYRFSFLGGSGGLMPGESDARTITVASRVTGTLTRTAMTLGTTTWFNGRVQPATRGRTVYLQRLVDGVWRPAGSRAQNIDGTVAFAIKPTARGTYTYRLYYGGDGWRSPGYTPGRTFTVS